MAREERCIKQKENATKTKSVPDISEVQRMIMKMEQERKRKFPDDGWEDSDSMNDEADEVKAEVSNLINETREYEFPEQADAFIKAGYPFIKFCAEDETSLVGIFNRIVFESKARYANAAGYLLKGLECDCIRNILFDARCVLFQCETQPEAEGYSAWPYTITHSYVAFLLPGTHRAIIVKICLR